jgi:DNA-binding response OmpR family regulator
LENETVWDVIVCEDFTDLREAMADYLRESGQWQVRAVGDGQALRQTLVERAADVLLLDVGLPHESGIEIARWAKATYPALGIVMLSGRTSPSDRLAGWRAGTDGYLSKPAQMEEVELALKAIVVRGQSAQALSKAAQNAPVLLVQQDVLVSIDGVRCRLAPRETMLLQVLAMPHGSLVLQDTLVDMLWPDGSENQENALFSLVRRLRRKLDGLGFPADALTAVRGRGYKLRAPLRLG